MRQFSFRDAAGVVRRGQLLDARQVDVGGTPRDVDGLVAASWLTRCGGEPVLMQDGSTSDLIFDVPQLVSFISQSITLEPGDLIATGTPAGVGVFRDPPVFLEPGDRVRCEIDGIGSVGNPVVDWTDDPRGR